MVKNNQIPQSIQKSIQELSRDHVHGSTYLVKKSMEVIINYCNLIDTEPYVSDDSNATFFTILAQIISSQPQMGLIGNLCMRLNQLIEINDNQVSTDLIKHYCSSFQQELNEDEKNIKNHVVEIIDSNATIMTYSFSSTIYHTLLYLQQTRGDITVLCSESRPKNEGCFLALELGNHHVKTKLVTDASLFSKIEEVDMILIGADAICFEGVINKIGSRPLFFLANTFDIPCYVLSTSKKILPKSYQFPTETLKPSGEISSLGFSDKFSVINTYFDLIPLEICSAIITEKGIFGIDDIKTMVEHG